MKTFIAFLFGTLLFGGTIIASDATSGPTINSFAETTTNDVVELSNLTFDGFEGGMYFFTREDGTAFTINTAYLVDSIHEKLSNESAIGKLFTCTVRMDASTKTMTVDGENVVEIRTISTKK